MLISEFARASGLTPDTIRFYIRRGLLKPETSRKGGSNPYQIFTAEHVQVAGRFDPIHSGHPHIEQHDIRG